MNNTVELPNCVCWCIIFRENFETVLKEFYDSVSAEMEKENELDKVQ